MPISTPNSLWERVVSGAKGQTVAKISQVLIQLLGVPIFLAAWGTELLGEWLILTAIPSYLSLSDLGLSQASINAMNMAVAKEDREEALRIFQSTLAILVGLGALICILLVGVTAVPLSNLLGLSILTNAQSQIVLGCSTITVLINLQTKLFAGGYQAQGMYGTAYSKMAGCAMFENMCCWAAALAGGSPAVAAAGLLGGRILAQVYFRKSMLRDVPWLQISLQQASLATVRTLFKPSLASLLFPLAQALNFQGMRIIVGMVLGPSFVTILATHRTLSRTLLQPMQMLSQIISPELGKAFGKGDLDLFRRLHRQACQLNLWFLIPTAAIIMFLGEPLLSFWTRGEVGYEPWLFNLLLISAIINALWYGSFAVEFATNNHLSLAKIFLPLTALAVVVAAALMATGFNLNGVSIALLILEVSMCFVVFPISLRLTQDTPRDFLRETVKPPVELVRKVHQHLVHTRK